MFKKLFKKPKTDPTVLSKNTGYTYTDEDFPPEYYGIREKLIKEYGPNSEMVKKFDKGIEEGLEIKHNLKNK